MQSYKFCHLFQSYLEIIVKDYRVSLYSGHHGFTGLIQTSDNSCLEVACNKGSLSVHTVADACVCCNLRFFSQLCFLSTLPTVSSWSILSPAVVGIFFGILEIFEGAVPLQVPDEVLIHMVTSTFIVLQYVEYHFCLYSPLNV